MGLSWLRGRTQHLVSPHPAADRERYARASHGCYLYRSIAGKPQTARRAPGWQVTASPQRQPPPGDSQPRSRRQPRPGNSGCGCGSGAGRSGRERPRRGAERSGAGGGYLNAAQRTVPGWAAERRSSSRHSWKLRMDMKHVKDYIYWLYFQYLLITCSYVLEPWERSMFHTITMTVFAMVVYTAYIFIPIHLRLAFEFFSQILGGQPEGTVSMVN